MLNYLGTGFRRYDVAPVRVYARGYWEFEAVLSGSIAPTFPRGGEENHPCRASCLWVFPPGVEHGWTGERGSAAEVAVFHFDLLGEPTASFIRKRGYLAVDLDAAARASIAEEARTAAEDRGKIDPLASLKADKIAAVLALIALSALSAAELAPLLNRAEYAAALADAWYSEHMAESPCLADAARAAACSPSHFRRLYRHARGSSPKEAFNRVRLERAHAMLRNGEGSIKEIAAACGYESQSCFSRAYRKWAGKAPREER